MNVIVGLGNPGSQYAGTRHNIGFDVIDVVARGGPFRDRFEALVAEARDGGKPVLYVKPQTYMNLSGRSVRAIVDFYKVSIAELLVICDDFNLPLGKLRLRLAGSAGGQNGLKSIQQMLGTDAYPRLRLGVGAPQHDKAVDHVLGKWKAGERAAVDDMVATAAQAVDVFVASGAAACMNRFNAGDDPKPKPKKLVAPPAAAGGPGPKTANPAKGSAGPDDPR
jgi:PTH1 family peptidyl-tRNA hydrolase